MREDRRMRERGGKRSKMKGSRGENGMGERKQKARERGQKENEGFWQKVIRGNKSIKKK